MERAPPPRSRHEISSALSRPAHVQEANPVRVGKMSSHEPGRNQVSRTVEWQRVKKAHRAQATAVSKSREPTPAIGCDEPGLGSSADGKGEEGIDKQVSMDGYSVAPGRARSPPSSVASRSNGEVAGSTSMNLPRMKGSRSVADGGCPLIEPCRRWRLGASGSFSASWPTSEPSAQPPFGALRCGDHHLPPSLENPFGAEGLGCD